MSGSERPGAQLRRERAGHGDTVRMSRPGGPPFPAARRRGLGPQVAQAVQRGRQQLLELVVEEKGNAASLPLLRPHTSPPACAAAPPGFQARWPGPGSPRARRAMTPKARSLTSSVRSESWLFSNGVRSAVDHQDAERGRPVGRAAPPGTRGRGRAPSRSPRRLAEMSSRTAGVPSGEPRPRSGLQRRPSFPAGSSSRKPPGRPEARSESCASRLAGAPPRPAGSRLHPG